MLHLTLSHRAGLTAACTAEMENVMNTSSAESRNGSNKKSGQAFNVSFDGDVRDAVGQGVDALKSVLGGFVNAVKEAIGPEGIRNLEASRWLAQAAICLEAVAMGLRVHGKIPPGKAGELIGHASRQRDTVDQEHSINVDALNRIAAG